MSQAWTNIRQIPGLPGIHLFPIRPLFWSRYNRSHKGSRHIASPTISTRSLAVRSRSVVIAVLLTGAVAWGGYVFWPRATSEHAGKASQHAGHGTATQEKERVAAHRAQSERPPKVEVVKPKVGASQRTIKQPGSVIPDKSAELYAKVSGYLKELGLDQDDKPIDIGSRVKEGQVLAVIDMPELKKQVQRDEASVKRAKAVVDQMTARITTAKAEFKAATAMLSFRTKVFKRLDQLARVEKAMDFRVVDEREEQMHAAEEAKNAAEARILQAEADLEEAKAEVELAQATLERAQVDLDYATIVSPYDGVITARNYWPGDFIRAHDAGGSLALLEVHKTDVVRVVVLIPDSDVPLVNPSAKATVTIDNLPGREFHGRVSRIADAQDPTTRNMRIEIDLENKNGDLRAGMYGSATIDLDAGKSP